MSLYKTQQREVFHGRYSNDKNTLEKRKGIAVIAEPQMSGVWFHSENWELEVRLLLLADFTYHFKSYVYP